VGSTHYKIVGQKKKKTPSVLFPVLPTPHKSENKIKSVCLKFAIPNKEHMGEKKFGQKKI